MIWHQISHFKPAERATGFFWHSRRLPGTNFEVLICTISFQNQDPPAGHHSLHPKLLHKYAIHVFEFTVSSSPMGSQCIDVYPNSVPLSPYPIPTSYPNIISEMNIQLSMSQLFPVYRPVYSESSVYIKNNCAFVFLSMLPLRKKFPTKCYWDQVLLDYLLRKILRGIVPLQKNGLVWIFRGKQIDWWWLSKPFSWLNCHHIQ